MTVANIRGAAVGKWIHNIGGMSSLASVVLVLVAAGGGHRHRRAGRGAGDHRRLAGRRRPASR